MDFQRARSADTSAHRRSAPFRCQMKDPSLGLSVAGSFNTKEIVDLVDLCSVDAILDLREIAFLSKITRESLREIAYL